MPEHKETDVRYGKVYTPDSDGWFVKKYTKENDGAWCEDTIALVDTETLADLLVTVCGPTTVYVEVGGGMVQRATIPEALLGRLNLVVVDYDYDGTAAEDERLIDSAGCIIEANVGDVEIRCEDGEEHIDQIIKAYRDSEIDQAC